jgi:hypothetical protein
MVAWKSWVMTGSSTTSRTNSSVRRGRSPPGAAAREERGEGAVVVVLRPSGYGRTRRVFPPEVPRSDRSGSGLSPAYSATSTLSGPITIAHIATKGLSPGTRY